MLPADYIGAREWDHQATGIYRVQQCFSDPSASVTGLGYKILQVLANLHVMLWLTGPRCKAAVTQTHMYSLQELRWRDTASHDNRRHVFLAQPSPVPAPS